MLLLETSGRPTLFKRLNDRMDTINDAVVRLKYVEDRDKCMV